MNYNPRYVNIVTYVHFTDGVWVLVISIIYIWPWNSVQRGGREKRGRIDEKRVLVKEGTI